MPATDIEPVGTYTAPAHGWTCYHCGETFITWGAAKDHFGPTPQDTAGCLLKIQLGGERGMLMKLREVEAENRKLWNDIHSEMTISQECARRIEAMLHGFNPFRQCRTIQDAFNVYDSKEGEWLALRDENARLCKIASDANDDANGLRDCQELLRSLGRYCGCDHVGSADDRQAQYRHITEAFDSLILRHNDAIEALKAMRGAWVGSPDETPETKAAWDRSWEVVQKGLVRA